MLKKILFLSLLFLLIFSTQAFALGFVNIGTYAIVNKTSIFVNFINFTPSNVLIENNAMLISGTGHHNIIKFNLKGNKGYGTYLGRMSQYYKNYSSSGIAFGQKNIVIGKRGNAYIIDKKHIIKLNKKGKQINFAYKKLISAVAIDKSGNIWVANNNINSFNVVELNPSGEIINKYHVNKLFNPYYITVGKKNNIWIECWNTTNFQNGGKIIKINHITKKIKTIIFKRHHSFDPPIKFNTNGNIYVIYHNSIEELNHEGKLIRKKTFKNNMEYIATTFAMDKFGDIWTYSLGIGKNFKSNPFILYELSPKLKIIKKFNLFKYNYKTFFYNLKTKKIISKKFKFNINNISIPNISIDKSGDVWVGVYNSENGQNYLLELWLAAF